MESTPISHAEGTDVQRPEKLLDGLARLDAINAQIVGRNMSTMAALGRNPAVALQDWERLKSLTAEYLLESEGA